MARKNRSDGIPLAQLSNASQLAVAMEMADDWLAVSELMDECGVPDAFEDGVPMTLADRVKWFKEKYYDKR